MTPRPGPLVACSFAGLAALAGSAAAQGFVEHTGRQVSYGDHTVETSWADGPAGVTLGFVGDGTLHEDGEGSSQRTSRNTLNFTSPAGSGNPQNYDDADLIAAYGPRLPLLQQMSASGTSVLTYRFDAAVTSPLDLFITDVDSSDAVSVAAFDSGDNPLDMTAWSRVASGDLSNFKDTGDDFSGVAAPPPLVAISSDAIRLDSATADNFNRTYDVFRSPEGVGLGSIAITFTGVNNSADRDSARRGSHIYVALSGTPIPEPATLGLLAAAGLAVAVRRPRRTA